ncbi:uncharacterized protein K452DRAFT_208217, partial [Aplosporella prunicola CBS 121167]
LRPKRSQVHRACDWCKLMRIKCEVGRPCRNCQVAGRECVTNGQNHFHFRSIAAAAKEVERLRAQVRELESRVRVDVTREVHYGVLSLPFFLKRMSAFLQTTGLHHQHPPLDGSTTPTTPVPLFSAVAGTDFLPRAQEDSFLDLFWQTHHFSYPIINEADFRLHYRSLWAGCAPHAPRQPSPLVDIVLALCIQLGASLIPDSQKPSYPALAGLQYYQRCQSLVADTIESPSITTVQCHVFSIVYLYEAGLLNRAQVLSGEAIMMAIILGLNNEPPADELEEQKEITRRTWWSLYILDAQLGMEVGRPFMVTPSHSNCHPPSDALDIAHSLGPHYMFGDGSTTWLGFQNRTLSLLETVRSISSAFHAKCLSETGTKSFYSNSATREEAAHFLTEQIKLLGAWASQVPVGYRMQRRGGEAFSTDRAPLDLDHNVPIQYQRQRLLLELQYHQHALNLYRPFICFAPTPEASTPLSDNKATSSLNHAITLTNLIHQALDASEVLNGMNQVFRWQKNALFTMLGFAYTFPISHYTAATCKAIDTAIKVVEMYSGVLPEAGQVSELARTLAGNVDAIISGFRRNSLPNDTSKALTRAGSSRPQTANGGS